MADAVRDLSGKLGLDTTDFKTAIAGANRELRVIESGFRASAAALGDWSKDASGLEMRIDALTKKIDLQQSKVAALRQEYERIVQTEGENSRAAQEMEIKLNKEVEALGKMQSELGDARGNLESMGSQSETTGGQVEDLGNKEDETREKTSKLGAVMGGLGTVLKGAITAIAAIGAAAAGAVAGIVGLVMKASDAAGELVDMSNKTGISTTKLQEMRYAGDQLGVSLDTMTGSQTKLKRSMGSVQDEVQKYNDKLAEAHAQHKNMAKVQEELDGSMSATWQAFNQLGIAVVDANGNLRDSQTVYDEAINALGGVSNETERDVLAMQLFGKSAEELNPLIKAGSGELNRLTQEAHDMGAVMDEEGVAALEDFGDQIAGLKAGLQGTLGTLAVAFLPMFQQLTGTAKTYLGEFSKIVKGSNGDLTKMASGIGQLLGKIITDMAKQAPQLLTAGLSIVKGIGSAILQALPTLIPAAVQMITSLLGFLIDALPMLMNAGVQLLLALVNGIVPQLPMLIETGLQMIITLVNGIAAALPQLIPVIVGIIPQIVLILLENLPQLIEAALQLILALAQGLIAAIPVLIPEIPKIVKAIFDALIKALPLIGTAALELLKTLAGGIVDNLPLIGTAAGDVIDALVTGVKNLASTIADVGSGIVDGIWSGIQANYTTFEANVKAFFVNIIAAVKKALGIASPSKVFAGIGENMAQGLAVGFSQAMADVQRQVEAGIDNLSGAVDFAVTGQAAGAKGQGRIINNYWTIYSKENPGSTRNAIEMTWSRMNGGAA